MHIENAFLCHATIETTTNFQSLFWSFYSFFLCHVYTVHNRCTIRLLRFVTKQSGKFVLLTIRSQFFFLFIFKLDNNSNRHAMNKQALINAPAYTLKIEQGEKHYSCQSF